MEDGGWMIGRKRTYPTTEVKDMPWRFTLDIHPCGRTLERDSHTSIEHVPEYRIPQTIGIHRQSQSQ